MSDHQQLQLDFFRKLGYSSSQIKTAMSKVGLSTDTNAVLAELVRTRASPSPPSEGKRLAAVAGRRSPGTSPQHPAVSTLEQQELEQNHEELGNDLKPIVIDGSNVAMSHGNKAVFSCRGIELAVAYFLERGHTKITVFVPSWRKEQPRPDVPISDQHILTKLEKQKIMVFTPSRRVGGKRVVCYDDRFIVKLAHELDGVIVSNDTYRDLQNEKPEWKRCIEERLLMYSFVNDKFMPPDDPLGRHGPTLDNFLRKKPVQPEQKRQLCPYGKKCTYGMKCKFYHPERANQPQRALADELRDNARLSSSPKEGSQRLTLVPRGDSGIPGSGPTSGSDAASLEQQLLQRHALNPYAVRGTPHMLEPTLGERWSGGDDVVNKLSRRPSSSSCGSSNCGEGGSVASADSGLGSYEQHHQQPDHRPNQHHSHTHNVCCGQARHPSLQEPSHPCLVCSPHPHAYPHPYLHTPPSQLPPCPAHLQLQYLSNPAGVPPFYPSAYTPVQHSSLPCYTQREGGDRGEWEASCFSEPPPWPQGDTSTPCSLPEISHWANLPRSGPLYLREKKYPKDIPGTQEVTLQAARGYSEAVAELQPLGNPDPEREEVRMKLHAIFNPFQVDRVMDMHPQVKDAQKLAAKILNLKSKGEIF